MNISEKIDEILAKRKMLLPQLENALERVQRARQAGSKGWRRSAARRM